MYQPVFKQLILHCWLIVDKGKNKQTNTRELTPALYFLCIRNYFDLSNYYEFYLSLWTENVNNDNHQRGFTSYCNNLKRNYSFALQEQPKLLKKKKKRPIDLWNHMLFHDICILLYHWYFLSNTECISYMSFKY